VREAGERLAKGLHERVAQSRKIARSGGEGT
jgi:hypothetical protein